MMCPLCKKVLISPLDEAYVKRDGKCFDCLKIEQEESLEKKCCICGCTNNTMFASNSGGFICAVCDTKGEV